MPVICAQDNRQQRWREAFAAVENEGFVTPTLGRRSHSNACGYISYPWQIRSRIEAQTPSQKEALWNNNTQAYQLCRRFVGRTRHWRWKSKCRRTSPPLTALNVHHFSAACWNQRNSGNTAPNIRSRQGRRIKLKNLHRPVNNRCYRIPATHSKACCYISHPWQLRCRIEVQTSSQKEALWNNNT